MSTYLLAWNPKKWSWPNLENSIDQIEQNGYLRERWSVISHRQIKPDDRVFLIRLGIEPKGIIASGIVVSEPYLSKHWSGEDKMVYRVDVDFDAILNAEYESIISLDRLKKGKFKNTNWTTQSSGILIEDDVAIELNEIWRELLSDKGYAATSKIVKPQDTKSVYYEGTPNIIPTTAYERNPHARKACLDHYGYLCYVCEFDFEKKYGEIGKGFIHVHHKYKISEPKKKNKVDPIKDLVPVCPNCHAMIHSRKDPYSIDEIKKIMKLA